MKNTSLLHFTKSGLLTVVQDQGRHHHQKYGVPVGGAMDKKSAAIANWLVGNKLSNPILEVTFVGPSFSVEGDCQMAFTGANLSATINGQPIQHYETIDVSDGSIISFGKNKWGCRAYIGIGGTWKIRPWLGSVSAMPFNPDQITPDSIIGNRGCIKINTSSKIKPRTFRIDKLETLSSGHRVSILPGPEFNLFNPLSIGTFFSRSYRISPQSNRMGYRLDGIIPHFNPSHELISSGCLPGTIQVTNSGQPIILMADAQTTGGYYRIGNVIKMDLDLLAQARPGDYIEFKLINYHEAQKLLRAYLDWEKILTK